MTVNILAIGSRGDVQPYVALALGLRDAGRRVRLITLPGFANLIQPYKLDHIEILKTSAQHVAGTSPGVQDWVDSANNFVASWRGFIRLFGHLGAEGIRDTLKACAEGEAIVVSPLGMLSGYHVAEKLRQPLFRAFYLPTIPSRYDLRGDGYQRSPVRGTFHVLKEHVRRQMTWQLLRPHTNRLRGQILNLAPIGLNEPFSAMQRNRVPLLYGFSPAVFPRPPDWGEWIHVTGYWFLPTGTQWRPPADLVEFLAAGPAPVIVSFGSMTTREPQQTTAIVVAALAQTGQRGILVKGAGGLGDAELPPDMFMLESAPFDWLFAHASAVIHHAGAGTTAWGLRAGLPTIAVPSFADQSLWAERVKALGVGPDPIPRRELSVARLATAIHQTTHSSEMRHRAAAVSARIKTEDGVGQAVQILDRYLNAYRSTAQLVAVSNSG